MRIAVTGASGFIGSHLVDGLLTRGDEVCALVRPQSPSSYDLPKAVEKRETDLMQADQVLSALQDFMPDALCHLAAQSLPTVSWSDPQGTIQFNATSTLNLFDAARSMNFRGPILIAGSSSEYAPQSDADIAIDEHHPIGAGSPYAVSKIAADQLAQLYAKHHGLRIIRMRPFFWIGPRKTGDFSSDIARRIVEVENGRAASLKTGNLDAVRDFLDVRDGVQAMLVLLERGVGGEAYNICSGKGYRLGDILDTYLGLTGKRIRAETDPALLRPLDEAVRIGDPRKIMALGWKPHRRIEDTLKEILQFWHQQAA